MNQLLRALVLCACILAINCGITPQNNNTLTDLQKDFKNNVVADSDSGPFNFLKKMLKYFENKEDKQIKSVPQPQSNSTTQRKKRQLDPSYYGFDDFYTNDFLYDYYDWVCSEEACQLCNILTSECCDPTVNVNCFLPDSCLNNPCLSGGTCVTTRTINGDFPDFICVCLPGFTGKYCQLTNEFMFAPALGGPGFGGPSGPSGPNINNNDAPSQSYGYQQQSPPNYGRPPQNAPIPYGPGPQSAPIPYGPGPQSAPIPYGPGPQSAPIPYGPGPQNAPIPYGPGPQNAPIPYGPGPQNAPIPYGSGPQGIPKQRDPAPFPPQNPYNQPPRQGAPLSPFPFSAPGPIPAPGPAPSPYGGGGFPPQGRSGVAKPLSAKSSGSWEGFDCNCQGKGYCAQVGSEDGAEPEFFCICNDNTYGSRCDEGFQNPCLDTTMRAKFAPIDRRVPGYYFVECRTNLPYIRKCENGKRFNPKANMCQTVKRISKPQTNFQQFQQQ